MPALPSSAVNAVFAAAVTARDAEWRLGGVAPGAACRVIVGDADDPMGGAARYPAMQGRPILTGRTVSVRAADVATPGRGDIVIVGDGALQVISDPMHRDPFRLVWIMSARALDAVPD